MLPIHVGCMCRWSNREHHTIIITIVLTGEKTDIVLVVDVALIAFIIIIVIVVLNVAVFLMIVVVFITMTINICIMSISK
jgi:hypothetical protein